MPKVSLWKAFVFLLGLQHGHGGFRCQQNSPGSCPGVIYKTTTALIPAFRVLRPVTSLTSPSLDDGQIHQVKLNSEGLEGQSPEGGQKRGQEGNRELRKLLLVIGFSLTQFHVAELLLWKIWINIIFPPGCLNPEVDILQMIGFLYIQNRREKKVKQEKEKIICDL